MPNPVVIVEGATTIIKGADELTNGNISINIDSQSVDGDKNPDDCTCPNVTRYNKVVMSLTHRAFLQKLVSPNGKAVSLSIGIRWQGNGCDVIGATPYLATGSSAGYGTSVTGSISAVRSAVTRPQQICDCCEKAAVAEFSVALLVNPLIGETVTYSGYIIVCANGEVGAEWQ